MKKFEVYESLNKVHFENNVPFPKKRGALFREVLFCRLMCLLSIYVELEFFQVDRPEDWKQVPDPKKCFVHFFGTNEM